MKTYIYISICFSFILLGSFQVQASDRYISDILIVTLRDAPSRNSNIIGHLRSGDYMKVLEENENGYIRVRVSSGNEGWVPKKYTAEGKSKDSIIKQLKLTAASFEDRKNSNKSRVADLTAQVNDYQSKIDSNATQEAKQLAHILDLEKQVAEAQDKYITLKDQSKGVEEVYSERETLLKTNEDLQQEVTVLTMENSEIDQTKNIFWFLAGAAVLLIGCVIGRSGKKSRRNSLTL